MEKDRCPRTDGSADFPEESARKEEKVVYSKREVRPGGPLQTGLVCDNFVSLGIISRYAVSSLHKSAWSFSMYCSLFSSSCFM